MLSNESSPKHVEDAEFSSRRTKRLKPYAALVFCGLIAVVGWAMMSLTSSPGMKGAALLWLPAALQLIAGVWLGPTLGMIAGGLGAYAAGILAYGGWGLADIIMNPIAGGIANSLLPALLFRLLRINPDFGAKSNVSNLNVAFVRIGGTVIAVLVLSIIVLRVFPHLGPWGYIPQALILLAALYSLSQEHKGGLRVRDLYLAIAICFLASFLSASIGVVGAIVGGLTLRAAIISVGIGWFAGDTISSLLGLYALAALTKKARERGICDDI